MRRTDVRACRRVGCRARGLHRRYRHDAQPGHGQQSRQQQPSVVAERVASTAPAASPSELASGAPTSVDPCALIPPAMASQLAGTTFTTGTPTTTAGGGKFCDYGDGTTNVFHVVVTQAADQKTADAAKADAEAAIVKEAAEGREVHRGAVESARNVRARLHRGRRDLPGGARQRERDLCLKGLIFFGFSDLALGAPTPSADVAPGRRQRAMLTRLP